MNISSFCLTALLFTSGILDSAFALRNLANGRPLNDLAFPRIYTAVVPSADHEDPDQHAIHFRAEVDFLDIVETGIRPSHAASGEVSDHIRISFLVHSAQELSYLESLNAASDIEMDATLTHQLHQEASSQDSDEGDGGRRLQQFSTISGFSCYKNLAGSYAFLNNLRDRASSVPNLEVTVTDIGDSWAKTDNSNLGYDIFALRVTGNGVSAAGRTTEKGIMFVMSGIHAREYAPPELLGRWIESMIDSYGNDADITSILDHSEIHIVLQANPDGRYVAETDRSAYRRKNMNPVGGSVFQCGQDGIGVDLNRNFPFRWGLNSGSSGDGCAETYRGPSPASEPEVQAIVNYCKSIFPTEQRKTDPEGQLDLPYSEDANGIFFDVHSYAEVIIWPWGHQNLETGNGSGLQTLVNKYKHFNGYGYAGPLNGYSYPASGATDDWAYGTLGAAGMTLELGNSFYQNCNYFENDVYPRNAPVLTYAAKVSKAPYRIPKGPDVTTLSAVANGNTLSVTATASDSALSAGDYPTSKQSVTEITLFLNVHPDDMVNGQAPTGSTLGNGSSGSLTVDISALPAGRHTVYVQATDSDGYSGPVTAAYFEKSPSNSGEEDSAPTIPPPPPEVCADTDGSFYVNTIDQDKDCDWLSINTNRFGYLCAYLNVAFLCPLTCEQCEVFA